MENEILYSALKESKKDIIKIVKEKSNKLKDMIKLFKEELRKTNHKDRIKKLQNYLDILNSGEITEEVLDKIESYMYAIIDNGYENEEKEKEEEEGEGEEEEEKKEKDKKEEKKEGKDNKKEQGSKDYRKSFVEEQKLVKKYLASAILEELKHLAKELKEKEERFGSASKELEQLKQEQKELTKLLARLTNSKTKVSVIEEDKAKHLSKLTLRRGKNKGKDITICY